MKGTLIGWTAAGLAGVGVFAGVATAANGATNTANTSNATTTLTAAHTGLSQKAVARAERKLARGSVRGEVVLDTKKGAVTVGFQGGTTSNVSSGTVTVTDKTGTAQTWSVSSDTKVRERGVASPQLSDDERVVVVGVKSDGTLAARLIVIAPAKATLTAGGQPTA